MLAEREPVPRGVVRHRVLRRVLPERAHQLTLELRVPSEPEQAAREIDARIGVAPVGEARPEEAKPVIPCVAEEQLLQLRPGLGYQLSHFIPCAERRGLAWDSLVLPPAPARETRTRAQRCRGGTTRGGRRCRDSSRGCPPSGRRARRARTATARPPRAAARMSGRASSAERRPPGPEDATHLVPPGELQLLCQVSEHRERVDEVELPILEGERRCKPVHLEAREAQIPAAPVDRRAADVAAGNCPLEAPGTTSSPARSRNRSRAPISTSSSGTCAAIAS